MELTPSTYFSKRTGVSRLREVERLDENLVFIKSQNLASFAEA